MTRDSAKKRAVIAYVKYAEHGYPEPDSIRSFHDAELALDLLAVSGMLEKLDREGKGYISAAVRDVYMFANSSSRKCITSERVVAHAMTAYADERTVWRWLRHAKELFAELRADESG
jgi:hypothetical protein